MIKFGWWEQFKSWLVCRYLRDRYNMSHCQWGVRRKRVMGAIMDGIRAEFTEDNMPTALHFVVEEMLENCSEAHSGNYTIIIGEGVPRPGPEDEEEWDLEPNEGAWV